MTATHSQPRADTPGVAIHELRKAYGDTVAVDGISLEVSPGEIYGIIGPDAAGKTTTMRTTCGLLLPDSGDVQVMGFDPVSDSMEVRNRIGYMPQRFSLYPDLSVEENLSFFAHLFNVPREEYERRVPDLYRFSRLGEFKSRRAGALSGGMKQKLALICTLVHTPDVLILDEPTFGVDPVSRKEFWDILKDLRDDGLALLVSTAYMDEARLCDRLALMHKGRFVATGTPDDVVGAFEHRLLEVRAERPQGVRDRLLPLRAESIDTHRFGDVLHVVYDTDWQRDLVMKKLEDEEVDVRDIGPDIEDVFVSLIRREEAV